MLSYNFAQTLITEARRLYCDEDLGLDLTNTVYAFDSTTIDLCMTLFPWAYFSSTQHALKLHTLLDLRARFPRLFALLRRAFTMSICWINSLLSRAPSTSWIAVTSTSNDSTAGPCTVLSLLPARGKNFRFLRLISHPVDKNTGVQCDQTISLQWFYSAKGYPAHLRRIRFWDAPRQKRLVFLTNNFTLPAHVIAELYRRRWHVELFFKWIKQHLRIKAFYGTSENAVKTQVWIAVCSYLLMAIVRKRLNQPLNLYTILQILSISFV